MEKNTTAQAGDSFAGNAFTAIFVGETGNINTYRAHKVPVSTPCSALTATVRFRESPAGSAKEHA